MEGSKNEPSKETKRHERRNEDTDSANDADATTAAETRARSKDGTGVRGGPTEGDSAASRRTPRKLTGRRERAGIEERFQPVFLYN
jgi:hypothetical protein